MTEEIKINKKTERRGSGSKKNVGSKPKFKTPVKAYTIYLTKEQKEAIVSTYGTLTEMNQSIGEHCINKINPQNEILEL